MANALELTNVTKKYKDFTLDDISFALPEGCILGLVGENGAGKSTTIRLIMDAIRADSGSIFVLGCDNRSREFTAWKDEIAVVLDEACFPERMTAEQADKILGDIYSGWESGTFFHYIEKFRIPRKKKFREFSRGMKMKFSIAAALSHRARLLILDEATSGLDPIVRDEILDIFYDFTRDEKHSILISSHIVSDLEKLCDYIAFIHEGKLLFCEEKDALSEKYGVLKCSGAFLDELDADAVLGKRVTGFGAEALVERDKVPAGLPLERAGIEEIMVAMVKESVGASERR